MPAGEPLKACPGRHQHAKLRPVPAGMKTARQPFGKNSSQFGIAKPAPAREQHWHKPRILPGDGLGPPPLRGRHTNLENDLHARHSPRSGEVKGTGVPLRPEDCNVSQPTQRRFGLNLLLNDRYRLRIASNATVCTEER